MKHCQHWSQVEYLHLTVTNPNISLKGQHSYYSGAWDGPFEQEAVRYLHGDSWSRSPDTGWEPLWHIDRLHIGDYVQIAAGVKIIMGGNHTHNPAFISTYPFADLDALKRSYRPAGDTRIGNDVWIGMDAMIMPGVTIGDGAIIAARSLVTQDVPPYCMVAGAPARVIRQRFAVQETTLLQALAWWDWPDEQVQALLPLIQQGEVARLEQAAARWHSAEQE
ncbi:CatB-related O-acetyltransferase [Aeromonas salmonicida]|uniref:CatB-related O-acetyltransferase n=1 Tax=Aeromonas salmonicida TaxID=645 RepID=UPI002864E89D|nr:CatB-related O-acetyltransferase [Aeromonas salmonicida]MDR7020245.1 chloramphenicol O-acetyltransferase type B [Aeromonas salmonicida]